jgi:hypothetical protein
MWRQDDEQALANELDVRQFMRQDKLKRLRLKQGPFYGTKNKENC